MCKILLCCNILLDLLLEPGWDGNDRGLEDRVQCIEKLRDLISSGEITLYIPPDLIQIAHMVANDSFDAKQACRMTQKILAIGTANLGVDHDLVLEQASGLVYPDNVELYEVTCLIYAIQIEVDAIVTAVSCSRSLRQILDLNHQFFSDFNIPILSPDSLIQFLSDDSVRQINNGNSIFVYTPKNRIVRLPKGSTAIDFAYAVHTDIGNRCVKALVNDCDYPLERPLFSGDVVEIVKGLEVYPDPKWIDFVVTTIAKKAIQRCLRRKCQQEGWIILKRELGKNVRNYRKKLESIAGQLGCKSIDELAAGVGIEGLVKRQRTEELAIKMGIKKLRIQDIVELIQQSSRQLGEDCLRFSEQSVLRGNGHRRFEIASCCYPLPGQPIVGLSTSPKRPLRIHSKECPKLESLEQSQMVDVDWNCEQALVQLQVRIVNHPDTLRPILNKLADNWQIPYNLHSVNPCCDGIS